MTSHFTGTTRKKMESRKAASEEVRHQTTAKNRQRGCRRDVRRQTGVEWYRKRPGVRLCALQSTLPNRATAVELVMGPRTGSRQ